MEKPATNVVAVLYYDGDCSFCNACAGFVKRFDTKKRITLSKLQGSEYDEPNGCYESILFIKGEKQYKFSSAVVAAIKTMGGLWWLLGVLLWLIPKPIRDFLYRFVGKRRHWFGGKEPVC